MDIITDRLGSGNPPSSTILNTGGGSNDWRPHRSCDNRRGQPAGV
ncbi:hypothetical protein [Laspinema palackyanum]